MAKLHNYYVLCPLIDQNSFLGVSRDQDDENVIVTLGRNVVNKYRLSDQKQLGGWTSKDHLTSAVIFDADQDAYVGVFNRNTIKIWKDHSCSLDKSKKYKFSVNIMKLLPRDNQAAIIIFDNGNCASLPYALENRKTYENKLLVKESDTIVDTACYKTHKTDYICHVIKNSKNCYEIMTAPIREELGDIELSKLSKIKVNRTEDIYVVGDLISTADNPCVYFMWSDTKVTEYNLVTKSWQTIGTVPWMSTISSVSIAWLGKNHLILFGSDTDQDGAIIVAYNVILGVGSCRYPMKMYSENAKLYCLNERIILEASNHIGMLSYILETDRNLSSLLGSHDIVVDNCAEIADWDTPVNPIFKFPCEVESLQKAGLTERSMCIKVIPSLLEKNEIQNIKRVLEKFEDIPESMLALLLNFAIKHINPYDVDITNSEEFINFCKSKNKGFQLLKYLFKINFSDAMLIPHLRSGLSLDDALFLLNYIFFLLVHSNEHIATYIESCLFDWCTLLMDSFYQQYLLSKDEKVSMTLNKAQNTVANLIDQLTVVDNTLPLIHKILSGKQSKEKAKESLLYAIELIQI